MVGEDLVSHYRDDDDGSSEIMVERFTCYEAESGGPVYSKSLKVGGKPWLLRRVALGRLDHPQETLVSSAVSTMGWSYLGYDQLFDRRHCP